MARYRLKGATLRRESSGTLKPYRVIFLSVEGKRTEPQYFGGLNRVLSRGGLPLPRCMIQVLKKNDHNSDPGHVIDLLEDYLDLRGGRYENMFPPAIIEQYGKCGIQKYFEGSLGVPKEQQFEKDAKSYGVHVGALRDLSRPITEQDVFGIVIDHDQRTDLRKHIDYCRERGYNVFLSTPCFELWLLLHFVNVLEEYDSEELMENPSVSRQHTFVSRELSRVAGTNKGVDFEKYEDKLFDAIERSRQMGEGVYSLIEKPGSNLCLLFDIIGGRRENMWTEEREAESAATRESKKGNSMV